MELDLSEYTYDDNLFSNLVDQLESSVTTFGGRKNLKTWIEKNIGHPTISGEPWSWHHHEYQIGIVEDQHPHIAVGKPAQCGLSELSLSMTLGLLAVIPNSQIIYSLQNQAFATKFSSTRFTPAIEKSEKLKVLVDKNVDSAQLKRLGNSYLHLVGSHSDSQSISVPATALINDEISFSNPSAIGTLMSRLEHLPEEKKILLQFSTPLYSGMGISEIIERGSKNVRMVLHDVCNTWVNFDCTQDFVIPGYDDTLENLSVRDLDDPAYDIEGSYLKCPGCGNTISQQNLADPTKRAWVPTFLERVGKLGVPSSYQVSPLDVAGIKYVPQIIRSLGLYKRTDRWFQYGIGVPYDSSEGRINPEVLERAFTGPSYAPDSGEKIYGAVMGSDVGKRSYCVVAKKYDDKLVVLWLDTIVQDGAGNLQNTWLEWIKAYGITKACIDSAPDFSSVKALQEVTPYNMAHGVYFTRGGANKAEFYEIKEAEGMVAVSRTRALSEFVKVFNSGKIVLPKNTPNRAEVTRHLMAMTRITEENSTGEEVERWVTSSPDNHTFFALFYAYLASEMQSESHIVTLPSSSTLLGRARIRSVSDGRDQRRGRLIA